MSQRAPRAGNTPWHQGRERLLSIQYMEKEAWVRAAVGHRALPRVYMYCVLRNRASKTSSMVAVHVLAARSSRETRIIRVA